MAVRRTNAHGAHQLATGNDDSVAETSHRVSAGCNAVRDAAIGVLVLFVYVYKATAT
jgi:hypothetical protein